MKFVYLSSLFMACALSAGAQGVYQFTDPGFEDSEWKSEFVDGGFLQDQEPRLSHAMIGILFIPHQVI